MKYDHVVKFQGRYYAAGENVPVEKKTVEAHESENTVTDKAEVNAEESVTSSKRGRPAKK